MFRKGILLLLTDIPYLEPLLMWLRKDETLKSEFTDKSFFMPHSDLISATEDAMRADCPAPRALWILPQDTLAQGQRDTCLTPGVHTFYIEVIVQCIRDSFQLVKRDDDVKLEGQFMELAALRKKVKASVRNFAINNAKPGPPKLFTDIFWVKDSMLYPSGENRFLATAIEFQIKIF